MRNMNINSSTRECIVSNYRSIRKNVLNANVYSLNRKGISMKNCVYVNIYLLIIYIFSIF